MLRRGLVALACAVIAAAAAGSAVAGPEPERSPSSGAPRIHPEAAPSGQAAQSTQTTQKTYSSQQASSTSNYTPPSSSQTQSPAVTYRQPPPARPHRATQALVHRAAKKKDPPVQLPTKRVASLASTGGQFLATSAHGLTKAPSSSESLLLLLVGLALVVLVVGETTFLRLAARGPAPQRAAEEPLPIRQVQLKR